MLHDRVAVAMTIVIPHMLQKLGKQEMG